MESIQVPAAAFPMQFRANVPREAERDDPNIYPLLLHGNTDAGSSSDASNNQIPVTYVGDLS